MNYANIIWYRSLYSSMYLGSTDYTHVRWWRESWPRMMFTHVYFDALSPQYPYASQYSSVIAMFSINLILIWLKYIIKYILPLYYDWTLWKIDLNITYLMWFDTILKCSSSPITLKNSYAANTTGFQRCITRGPEHEISFPGSISYEISLISDL